ncbi:MAG: hypothetical protein J1G06_03035 [Oscillospiraceae bacterium]|nr:hypothetical protein [Oscillospiraceae bacterium]
MSPELMAFALSAMCGSAALLLWDFMHGMRHSFVKGIIGNILLDTAWWFICAWMFLLCVWETVSLRLRFFELFAAVLGALLYHFTVSSAMKRCFCAFFDIILKIFKFIFKILLTPAVFLDKILLEPFKRRYREKRKRSDG